MLEWVRALSHIFTSKGSRVASAAAMDKSHVIFWYNQLRQLPLQRRFSPYSLYANTSQ
jgi:hypothetical protein